MNELLDEIPCGIVVCNNDGNMLYLNQEASRILQIEPQNAINKSILTYIDNCFCDDVRTLLTQVKTENTSNLFLYVSLKDKHDKFYKLTVKKSKDNNIIMMLCDHTSSKIRLDCLTKSVDMMNDNLIRNSIVLKTISDICNNVLYKDRSSIAEIIVRLCYAFHLPKAAICFRNGTGHLIYARRKDDNTYETGRLDGNDLKKDCVIWQNEVNYLDTKQLIFKIPCGITCCEYKCDTINILKLKLTSKRVVGFLEFTEDTNFKLSASDLNVLENLSQILAYIVNNKEQVLETTNYIRDQFSKLALV